MDALASARIALARVELEGAADTDDNHPLAVDRDGVISLAVGVLARCRRGRSRR